MAQTNVFSVLEYGAKADGLSDDSTAIHSAVAAAIEFGQPATVHFPAGCYCLKTPLDPAMIVIENASDLILEGEAETKLLSTDPNKTMVEVVRSTNVVVRNFQMDRNPLVFTQGIINSVDLETSAVEITIDSGYDEPDSRLIAPQNNFCVWFDNSSHSYDQREWWPKIVSRERISLMTWRFQLSKPPKDWYPGKKFLIWDNMYSGWGVVCRESADILIEDIRYYGGGAESGVAVWNCTGEITYRRFTVGVPDGSDRLFAAAGGSLEFDNRCTLTFDECDVSNVDDDGVNIGTHFSKIRGQLSPNEVVVEIGGNISSRTFPFQVGDTVNVWDWELKRVYSEAKVLSVKRIDPHSISIEIDQVVTVLHSSTSDSLPKRDDWNGEGRFEEHDGIDRIASFEAAGKLIVRNCRFQSLRARNILVKTSDSIIENNTFHDTNMAAILVGPEFYWTEAPAVRNLVIRNNRFINVIGGNIVIGSHHSEHSYDNKNILIEGNTFDGYGGAKTMNQAGCSGAAITVRNAVGVTIRNNVFVKPSPDALKDAKAVIVEVSKNVVIEGNDGFPDQTLQ